MAFSCVDRAEPWERTPRLVFLRLVYKDCPGRASLLCVSAAYTTCVKETMQMLQHATKCSKMRRNAPKCPKMLQNDARLNSRKMVGKMTAAEEVYRSTWHFHACTEQSRGRERRVWSFSGLCTKIALDVTVSCACERRLYHLRQTNNANAPTCYKMRQNAPMLQNDARLNSR